MNTQITEDYVSFETAKLLKEKGFKGECLGVYFPNGRFDTFDTAFDYNLNDGNLSHAINAPTLQMAMKWLREVHGLFIEVHVIDSNTLYMDNKYYFYRLYKDRRPLKLVEKTFMTYEEACEDAIKYCLENLI